MPAGGDYGHEGAAIGVHGIGASSEKNAPDSDL